MSLLLLAGPLSSQATRVLTGELEQRGTCANCRLVARHLVTYGDASDPELIPNAAVFLRLRDGRLIVGNQRGGLIHYYGANGGYAGTLGRLGDGPGEYRNVKQMFEGPGDSITVLGSNSIAVLSLATGGGRSEPVLTQVMPDAVIRLPDGRIVFNTHYPRTPAFVMLGRDLKRESAFGPVMPSGPDRDGHFDEPIHRLATSARGGFWAAKMSHVRRIERWLPNGTVVQRLDSLVPWFARWKSTDEQHGEGFRWYFTHRPLPRTVAIEEDPAGQLWVLGLSADARWKPVSNPPALRTYEEYQSYTPPADPDRHMDAVFDVIDTRTGRSLGAWRLHEFFTALHPGGIATRIREDENGVRTLEAWRVELQGR